MTLTALVGTITTWLSAHDHRRNSLGVSFPADPHGDAVDLELDHASVSSRLPLP
jgi:hypothetical protein